EAFTPEDAVVAHPVGERIQTARLGAVVDIAALGALADEAGLLQALEMLGDCTLRDTAAAGQFHDGDLVGIDNALEHGPPRGIGKGAHDSGYGLSLGHKEP